MTPYHSKSGKPSGVIGYETGRTWIKVWFATGTYKYSYNSAGEEAVEQMKQLARNQLGLSTFIAQNNPGYEGLL